MTSVGHICLAALLGLVGVGVACDGAGPERAGAPAPAASSALRTGSAADEETRAAAYSAEAARYRSLADESRQVAAALPREADPAIASRQQAAAALADRLASEAQKVADLHARRAAETAAHARGEAGR
jgi:hypothetical protein